MKKIALFFFSGTGNTQFVAKKITDIFRKNVECSLFSIEKHLTDTAKIIQSSDLVGLAYPIYGSSIPLIVRDFIERLEHNDKEAFVFCTQLMYSGDGAAYGGRLLGNKGFKVLWQEHFRMPNNITDLRILTSKKKPNYGNIEKRVEIKASRFVTRILSGKPKRKGSNFMSLLLGLVQRVPYEKIEQSAYKEAIRINHELCSMCNKCIVLCPTANLEEKDGLIVAKANCTLCYRCINHCPEKAMHIISKKGIKYPYLGPSADYRIAAVMRDDIFSE